MTRWEWVNETEQTTRPRARIFEFDSDTELPGILNQHFPEGPPGAYTVINAESLRARMQRAFEQWEEDHRAA